MKNWINKRRTEWRTFPRFNKGAIIILMICAALHLCFSVYFFTRGFQ